MIGLEITFLAGRFHATPWGRHANEAQAEWPPSPWRILRALVATWKRKCDHLEEAEVREVLRNLAEPPIFHLPPATLAHTRHFMPWFKNFKDNGPNAKTLVFDAFVAVEKSDALLVLWPDAELTGDQLAMLTELAGNMSILGRAESWCSVSVADESRIQSLLETINSYPLNSSSEFQSNRETRNVSTLCPAPDECFSSETTKQSGRGKNARSIYDPDWAICAETLDLHSNNQIDPPGSRWLNYSRPADCFESPLRKNTIRMTEADAPQIVRFALDSNVLPLVTKTLHIAEDARWNLMGYYGRQFDGSASAVFSGKDPDDPEGKPLAGHGHAYYIPTDEDGDGRLDHLTIVARDGFQRREMQVLDRIRRIKTRDRDRSGHQLNLMLVGLGNLEEFSPKIFRAANTFVSQTPFVAHQHFKKNGKKKHPPELAGKPIEFLEYLVREELVRWFERNASSVSMAESAGITPILDEQGNFRLGNTPANPRPIEFKRSRRKRGDDGARRLSGFFRVEFPEPVRGPLCLGHSSHFGLGLFVPVEDC